MSLEVNQNRFHVAVGSDHVSNIIAMTTLEIQQLPENHTDILGSIHMLTSTRPYQITDAMHSLSSSNLENINRVMYALRRRNEVTMPQERALTQSISAINHEQGIRKDKAQNKIIENLRISVNMLKIGVVCLGVFRIIEVGIKVVHTNSTPINIPDIAIESAKASIPFVIGAAASSIYKNANKILKKTEIFENIV